jgi:quinolinate synthase
MADFTGSSSAIVDWCAGQAAEAFIVATDSGLRYSLEKRAAGKKFFFVANESCNCSECPYLRANTLEKLVMCLETLAPRIELSATILERASIPLLRMLAVN